MKITKVLAIALTAMLLATTMFGCGSSSQSDSGGSAGATELETETEAEAGSETTPTTEKKSIVLISKSYQNQFYQAAFKGAMDAGEKYGFEVTTNGPDSESNIPQQVDQVSAAINQKPTAIALAACDPESLQETLTKAKTNGIPVIGFDSGVPGDTSGAVVATAATDNTNAGAFVAENLFNDPTFQARMMEGTEANPAILAILAQDSTSGSIVFRVNGFVDKMGELLQTLDGLEGAVEVTGQTIWNKASASPAKVKIVITVPPSTNQADIQTAASTMLKVPNTVALFAANQGAVDGLLGATADGMDLDRAAGKYKDLIVVGFDAGKGQKEAIANGSFFGSVTQDPYTMGYEAVRIAAEIAEGKTPADIDTGARWYNSENITDPEISVLLYD